jgi:hypothetical protein
MRSSIFPIIFGLCLLPVPALAEMSEAEIEKWLNNDTDELPTDKINEGKLRFLPKPPVKKVHHHHNTMIVYKDSMKNGWVKMLQCHRHLDKFPRAQVLYHKKRVRNIRITKVVNIGKAWVKKNSVQLTNVKKNAQLCVEADSKALVKNADGSFTLKNGPFMRRFLDGFFPMRVSMDLQLPKNLKFISIHPQKQHGFRVNSSVKGVHFDAWFEGKLNTKIKLIPIR